ncbi:MAG: alpha-2-macroglobulin [Proteobacteria bacterium]|nr:MAG: alpha-2-macroglobulin [Pseudomonadota bacterium]
MTRRGWLRATAAAAALLGIGSPVLAARVESFSPTGVAKQVRQVAARFSEPVVPLGDPRAARDPFAIECPAQGASRWADGASWVFTFEENLPAGVECVFTLKPDVRTLAGAPIEGPQRFAFSTGGPAVLEAEPSWGKVAEDQRFALKLDAPATRASVEAHVAIRAEGLPDPIGVRVVEGAERDALVARLDWDPADARHLVLEARQRFAPEAKLVLHWGAGVATPSGVAGDRAQTFEFEVRPAFGARLGCERENAKAACVPIARMRLAFSSPVAWEAASRVELVESAPAAGAAPRAWKAERVDADDGDPLVEAVQFRGPFPPHAKLVARIPADLRDDAGRALPRSAIEIATGRLPPLAKFSSRFGVVEAAAPVLPVALRHVAGGAVLRGQTIARAASLGAASPAEIARWLRALGAQDTGEASVFAAQGAAAQPQSLALPAATPGDDAEVVGIPLDGAGLHVVEIESRLLGEALLDPPQPMYVAAGALVTNLAVHLAWGRESSLVWVTTLDRAEPVAGAAVSVVDCRGAQLAEASTDADGVARIASLPGFDAAPSCNESGWSQYGQGLLVLARHGGDLGLAHSSWGEGLEAWRFGLPTEWSPRSEQAHTIFDRTLLRAGDTVHMKHVLRRPVQAGFAAAPPEARPAQALIRHVGSDDSWELPVAFENGSALGEWTIPKTAKLGHYEVSLRRADGGWIGEGASGAFRVEAFRVPLMRGVVQPPRDALVQPSELPLDLAVAYLAGGGASDQTVTLRTQLRERGAVTFPDWDGFTFANGGVEEGVRRRAFGDLSPAWERDWEWAEDGSLGVLWRAPEAGDARGPVAAQEVKLDARGTARATVAGLPRSERPLELQAEVAFRDPSGETQTASARVPLWPSSRVVGLKADDFAAQGRIRLHGAVLDLAGAPIRWTGVRVDAYETRSYAARKRMVGGFYAYEHVEEVRRVGRFCAARTDRAGRFACEGAAPARGQLALVATTSDWMLRPSTAHASVWVPGEDDGWFAQGDSDRIELVPERRRYEPGETARLQVRMPFRAATALVAVGREGVAETFVAKLSGADPVVEVPIAGAHAPNVFVSVLAVRGREAEPAPTGRVDLAKPAYRLGIAELQVGWKERSLAVRVEPARATYRVRETAEVRIAVRTPDGGAPPPGSEVAIAAVDEGLLELLPNTSWKLLDAMMGRRAYAVRHATASMQVVGKRHYGRKAVPSGGGGGQRPTRELFDTLLLWNGRVALDAAGDAQVAIPLNDSLTSFRIAAVATGGDDRFGTGEASIRTTQEVMVLEGLPERVREQDRFAAGFTLRNTTDETQDVVLRAKVEGLSSALPPIERSLAPGESAELVWDVTVPVGADALRWDVELASSSGATDHLRFAQQVTPAVPVRVLQAALVQVTGAAEVPVERPADALEGRGGLGVALRPRLADGRDGIERAMRAYPYTCLEQLASVAIALRDAARWQAVMESLPAHLDGDGLAKFFPTLSQGSVVLTAYLVAIAHAAEREIPAAPRERMLGALARFVDGSLERDEVVRAADLPLRKLAAAEALARHGRLSPAQAGAVAVDPRLLPNGALLDWIGVLAGTPGAPQRDAKLAEADALLRARLDVQGTTLGFATSRSGAAGWLLATTDVNAARLVLARVGAPGWQDDAPKLVRALLALQRRGAWPTTLANAWGTLALDAFSRAHETVPVAGATTVHVGVAHGRIDWTKAPQGGALSLPWPDARAALALRHDGAGAPWAIVQSAAAVPLREAFSSGYRIEKRIEPVSQRTPGAWSRGDVARVRLEVEAEAEAAWVVVDDPLPAGASILGRGLGGDTGLLSQGERDAGSAWTAFTEARDDAWRRYYEWAPQGRFAAEYTVRFDQPGRFAMPPTRVEALYSPERFGERPNDPIEVAP